MDVGKLNGRTLLLTGRLHALCEFAEVLQRYAAGMATTTGGTDLQRAAAVLCAHEAGVEEVLAWMRAAVRDCHEELEALKLEARPPASRP